MFLFRNCLHICIQFRKRIFEQVIMNCSKFAHALNNFEALRGLLGCMIAPYGRMFAYIFIFFFLKICKCSKESVRRCTLSIQKIPAIGNCLSKLLIVSRSLSSETIKIRVGIILRVLKQFPKRFQILCHGFFPAFKHSVKNCRFFRSCSDAVDIERKLLSLAGCLNGVHTV